MVRVGSAVKDVTATTQDGTTVRLSDLAADGPLVVSFYPKAFTPGCTAQTCHLRDRAAEFAEIGATVVGVSGDSVQTQSEFAAKHRLSFPLLADTDGALAKTLGAKRPGPLPPRRQTVVLDSDLTVLGTIRSETNMDQHADEALELLRSHM
jgi:peroxiredoxin Q/BCP